MKTFLINTAHTMYLQNLLSSTRNIKGWALFALCGSTVDTTGAQWTGTLGQFQCTVACRVYIEYLH